MSIGGTTFGCTVHLATRHRLVTVTRDWRSESLIMSSDVLTLARQSNFHCQLLPKIVTSEEAHCQGQSEQHTERSSAPYKICQKNCCHSISYLMQVAFVTSPFSKQHSVEYLISRDSQLFIFTYSCLHLKDESFNTFKIKPPIQ